LLTQESALALPKHSILPANCVTWANALTVANRTAEAGIEEKADCQQGIGVGHMSGDLRELKRAISGLLGQVANTKLIR